MGVVVRLSWKKVGTSQDLNCFHVSKIGFGFQNVA